MTGTDVLRDELRTLYPQPSARPDWEDVLRRVGGRPAPPARRRHAWWAAIPVVAGALAALAVVAPWSGGAPFSERALASLGAARYLRVVVEPPDARFGAVVDLRTGASRPSSERRVDEYDSRTGALEETTYVDGVALGSAPQALPNPGLAAFLGGYRQALASGSATVTGESTYRGRPVQLLRFEPQPAPVKDGAGRPYFRVQYVPGTTEVVAVDTATYRPLWYRFDTPAVLPSRRAERGPVEHVIAVSSSATSSRPLRASTLEGQAEPVNAVTSRAATVALRHQALWLGPRIGGLRLRSIRLEQVSTYRDVTGPTIRSGPGLHLVYGGSKGVQLWETQQPEVSYGFVSARLADDGPLPRLGFARVACGLCGFGGVPGGPVWTAELRSDGLFVSLQAPTRKLLVEAARKLDRIR